MVRAPQSVWTQCLRNRLSLAVFWEISLQDRTQAFMILLHSKRAKHRKGFRRSGLRIVIPDMPVHALSIVCTNVAESGVTIPNVGLVISSGVQRRVSTDIRTGSTVNALQTLSKAQLLQQVGTGRIDQGVHITMISHQVSPQTWHNWKRVASVP